MNKRKQDFQKRKVEMFKNGELSYEDASIYTVLRELCEGNGVCEVFMMLHNVATDLDEREILESEFEKAKNYKWT